MSKHQGKDQIKTSFDNVANVQRDTTQKISFFKQKNQKLQKESRKNDDSKKQQRFDKIQQEIMSSSKKNTALEMKWAELKEEEECQRLNSQIQEQKDLYQEVINGKKSVIRQFQLELRKKDDEYGKMLKQQAKDIKQMVTQMRSQFFTLRQQNLKELDEIQKKFQLQRKNYLKKARQQVEECFRKHIQMQGSNSQKRNTQEDEFVKTIEDLRIAGAKEYAQVKIDMETNIQNLEKCLQEMKAAYQLNTEKLQYNLRVLKQKNEQNQIASVQLKKKQRILINKLKNLRDQYNDLDISFKKKNKDLTSEYKRITRQFKELQRKFKHFQKADSDRYNQIRSMNEAEVQFLKQKIIECDKTIHLQQLGTQWTGNTQLQQKTKQQQSYNLEQNQKEEDVAIILTQDKVNKIVDIMLEESDFIFDDKMREQLERCQQSVKVKQKMNLLKKTLSIDSIDQMNMFFQELVNRTKYISQKQKKEIEDQRIKKEQQEEEKMRKKKKDRPQQQKKEEVPVEEKRVDLQGDFEIQPTMVVDFLILWMNTKDERKKYLQNTLKKSKKQLSERQRKQIIARQGKKYWQNLTQVLPRRTFRVWKVLDRCLSKYYELLLNRQKLISQTSQLHSQNEQLNNLLNQYLHINHQLKIPPTQMIKQIDDM